MQDIENLNNAKIQFYLEFSLHSLYTYNNSKSYKKSNFCDELKFTRDTNRRQCRIEIMNRKTLTAKVTKYVTFAIEFIIAKNSKHIPCLNPILD